MAKGERLGVETDLLGATVRYVHHGIDVGDGTVVHARPDDFRRPFGGGRIVRTSVAAFAAGRPVRVIAEPAARFSRDEIVRRALAHVDREGYCPVVANCEHFTTWCATGARSSRQIDLVAARLAAAGRRGLALVTARASLRAVTRAGVAVGSRGLVLPALVAEAAALVAEWRAHQSGWAEAESRRAGEAAGLAASITACGLAGLPAGPAGVLTGGVTGAALWAAGAVGAAGALAIERTSSPASNCLSGRRRSRHSGW